MQLPADPDLVAAAQDIVQQWSPLARHPNLSTPTEAFITSQMEGGPALVFVHAYYPAAITLEQAHMHQGAGKVLAFSGHAFTACFHMLECSIAAHLVEFPHAVCIPAFWALCSRHEISHWRCMAASAEAMHGVRACMRCAGTQLVYA